MAAFVVVIGGTRATSLLHMELLKRCLRAPIAFFDVTPVGRIVNRFSKDLDTVDTLIPRNFEMWYMCMFKVLGTIFVISYSTPFFLMVLLPLGIFYYFVQVQRKKNLSIYLSPCPLHYLTKRELYGQFLKLMLLHAICFIVQVLYAIWLQEAKPDTSRGRTSLC